MFLKLCDIAACPDNLCAVRLVELLELVTVMLFELPLLDRPIQDACRVGACHKISKSLRTNIVHNEIMKEEALVQFKLLLPAALKKRLETHATLNRRSLSQEIVVALEEKYPAAEPDTTSDPAARMLFWLAKRIRRRNPKPGTPRDKQAALYERIAGDIAERMKDIGE